MSFFRKIKSITCIYNLDVDRKDNTDVTDSRRTERMKRGRQEMLDETEVKGEFRVLELEVRNGHKQTNR